MDEEVHQRSPYNVAIDSTILMNSRVWKPADIWRISTILDGLQKLQSRFRADKLIEEKMTSREWTEMRTVGRTSRWKVIIAEHVLNARNAA
jgi:glycyl-tRNA synthetase (class II)